jgi:polar amino acid transport system substrate-binding protein
MCGGQFMQRLRGAMIKSSKVSYCASRITAFGHGLFCHWRWIGAASVLATAGVADAVADDIVLSSEVAATGKLSIANTIDYAPFGYVGEDGEPEGIVIELAGAMAKLLKVDLDLQRTPFPALMPGLTSGRFSIAWETFSISAERLEQVDFIVFLRGGIAISSRPDLAEDFADEWGICGKRVGVSAGSASDFLVDSLSEECVSNSKEAVAKSVFNSSQDIVQAVMSGRIDARVDDATASSYFERISDGQLVVAPRLFDVAPLGLALVKGDTETSQMVLSALATLFETGVYHEVLKHHGMASYAVAAPYFVDSLDDLRDE